MCLYVQKLTETYPKRPAAVIGAKSSSTTICLGLNDELGLKKGTHARKASNPPFAFYQATVEWEKKFHPAGGWKQIHVTIFR